MRWKFWKPRKGKEMIHKGSHPTEPMEVSDAALQGLAHVQLARVQLSNQRVEVRTQVAETLRLKQRSLELYDLNHFGDSLDEAFRRRHK